MNEENELHFGDSEVIDIIPHALSIIAGGDVWYGMELLRRSIQEAGYKQVAQTIAELQRGVA
jgi:phage FluMu protein gp41